MHTSLEALSNEHLQEQATKARVAARILHAHLTGAMWRATDPRSTGGGIHQD